MPQLTELYRYIFPLLTSDERRPNVLGTAFLVAAGDMHFIVTAAHVVEAENSSTLSFGRGVFVQPSSTTIVTTGMPPSGRREDDPVDVAVWRADAAMASAILAQGTLAVTMDQACIEDTAGAGDRYVFSGYPANRTRRSSRELDLGPMSVNCEAVVGDRLHALGLHHHFHVVGKFNRRRMANLQGQQMTASDPRGMSGGPVWKIEGNNCRLVGLGIEHRANQRVLIGTRIAIAAALLRANFPETRDFIAEPSLFTTR